MFNRLKYEQLSDSLSTSREFLYAIEKISGEEFEYIDNENAGCPELNKNAAYELWKEGGNENKILAALPIENAIDNDEIFWGDFIAKFNGKDWIYKNVYKD